MGKNYKCIFFDLDHTLWDYETNSFESLSELYQHYNLSSKGAAPYTTFFKNFVSINNHLWDQYDRGEIHRDVIRNERFHRVLLQSGIDDREMSLRFSEDYLRESPRKSGLIANAAHVLTYLNQKYPLYIVTNGFEEIQGTKMESSGITRYFKGVVTSARAGHKKPAKEIFEFALRENGHRAEDSIMIGDNLLTDIAGARNADIDQVFFNPAKVTHNEAISYEISDLKELMQIL